MTLRHTNTMNLETSKQIGPMNRTTQDNPSTPWETSKQNIRIGRENFLNVRTTCLSLKNGMYPGNGEKGKVNSRSVTDISMSITDEHF